MHVFTHIGVGLADLEDDIADNVIIVSLIVAIIDP
jgi:hypothetical protein